MNSKKSKFIVFSLGIILTVAVVILYTYIEDKKEILVNTAEYVDENEPEVLEETKTEIVNEVIGERPDGTLVYSEDEIDLSQPRKNHFDGGREAVEIKTDYTSLLNAQPIIFEPVFPKNLFKEKKIQIDRIDGYYGMNIEERVKLLEKRTDYSNEEKNEWEKINKVNEEMARAFQKGDYNTYMKHLYKGWREYYGVSVGAVINSGEYSEGLVGFYPERIDLEIGLAYGIYVRETVFFINSMPVESRITDGFIMYKQDAAGNWEVYFEKPIPMNEKIEKAE